MHLRRKLYINRIVNVLVERMRHETQAVVVLVRLSCENRKSPEVHSVAVLEQIEVVVAHGNAYHVCDKRLVSRRRTHPAYIVVAPLDIRIVRFHQLVQNEIGAGTPVEDIPYYVEAVNRERLYQLAQ